MNQLNYVQKIRVPPILVKMAAFAKMGYVDVENRVMENSVKSAQVWIGPRQIFFFFKTDT